MVVKVARLLPDSKDARQVFAGAAIAAAMTAGLAGTRFLLEGARSPVGWTLVVGIAGFLVVLFAANSNITISAWGTPVVGAAVMLTMAAVEGGLGSEATYWMPLVPMVGGLFRGARGAASMAAGLVVGVALMMHGQVSGWLSPPAELEAAFILRVGGLIRAIVFGRLLGVTNERIRERAALETNAMKDEFVATVSHELRTPLTSIYGSLRLINGGAVGELSPDVLRLTGVASRNAERLSKLVDDLLELKRIESGQLELTLTPTPLAALIRSNVSLNEGYANEHDVTIAIDETVAACEVSVLADGDRLHQVLTNLVSNAIKHSPSTAEVRVSVVTSPKRVTVAVSDRGPGIPAEEQARIFERFAMGSSGAKGTGLGLPIASRLAERMGGALWFESAEGEGTTFCVALPRA